MSVAASGPRYHGGDVECGGARVRAQIRSVAAVITVTGRLDETNVEAVVGQLCRFVRLDDPLVVDVHDVDVDAEETIERLVSAFGAECHWGGVDWFWSPSPPTFRTSQEMTRTSCGLIPSPAR